MITANNYFENSSGNFSPICSAWSKKILNNNTINIENIPDIITLGNKEFILNHISLNERYKSISIYYVSKDNNYLIRLADHWSDSNNGIFCCGRIAHCYWTLNGHTTQPINYITDYWGYPKSYKIIGGIIAFKDME